ncbi:MAG: YfhO family protein [Bacilli bacterium]
MFKIMIKENKFYILALTIIVLLIVLIINPKDMLFGSNTDWLVQHVSIPEYFRLLFYKTGNLFPDYAPGLGSGQNIYNFSYYGLLRLDVLISYLLPFISMKDIIISYMVFSMIMSTNLCFIWLKSNNFNSRISFITSLLLLFSASYMYHSHTQIMFVNYMPWLFLAYLGIDYYISTNKSLIIIISIIMIIMHSYFFSVAIIFSCLFYYTLKLRVLGKKLIDYKKEFFKLCLIIFVAILCTSIYLLPTALALFSSPRGNESIPLLPLLKPLFSFNRLLYERYNLGLTFIALIGILYQLKNKAIRLHVLAIILFISIPIFTYIFNGTLYDRSKILILFIPIVLFLSASTLSQVKRDKLLYAITFYVIIIAAFKFQTNITFIIDMLITIPIIYLYTKTNKQTLLYLLLIPALINVFASNQSDTFIKTKTYDKMRSTSKENIFNEYITNSNNRFSDLTSKVSNANLITNEFMHKPTSYSSLYIKDYNNFYYDLIKNPIVSSNRVIQTSNTNPFSNGLLGVEYLFVKYRIPIGYTKVSSTKGKGLLVHSDDVLPIAYATSQLIDETSFNQLTYPYNLDTIYNNAVVKGQGNTNYQSMVTKEEVNYTIIKQSDHLKIIEDNNGYLITTPKKAKLKLSLDKNYQGKIMLISFKVDNSFQNHELSLNVTINGIRNRLSSKIAPYPNNNYEFHYIISSQQDLDHLNISFSQGIYLLSDVKVYTLDYEVIKQRKQEIDEFVPIASNDVLEGSINVSNDGYLITSIPYQSGFTVMVDNKKVAYEKVNTAFVGLPLKSGNHHIKISFKAPGKTIGTYLSIIGLITTIAIICYEKKESKV